MSSARSPEERLVEVEMSLVHLQHDFDRLNSVVLEQQTTIEALRRELHRLEARLARFESDELPGPADERPPHY